MFARPLRPGVAGGTRLQCSGRDPAWHPGSRSQELGRVTQILGGLIKFELDMTSPPVSPVLSPGPGPGAPRPGSGMRPSSGQSRCRWGARPAGPRGPRAGVLCVTRFTFPAFCPLPSPGWWLTSCHAHRWDPPGFPGSWSRGREGGWGQMKCGEWVQPPVKSPVASCGPPWGGGDVFHSGLANQSHLSAQMHRALACWTPNSATCWTASSSSMALSSPPCF